MSKKGHTFDSPSSRIIIAKILAFITEQGTATGAQVREVTGLSEHYNGAFLRHMKEKELIHAASRQVRTQSGSFPILWAPGAVPAIADEADDFPRKVVVRKQWEPNHVRMGFECFLFGAPVRAAA
jgi:hypothetical protein